MNESGEPSSTGGRPVAKAFTFTAIGRPLDPAFATNRAVLILLPAVAVVTGLLSALGPGSGGDIISAALRGMLVAFGAWALARELAPDDDAAAFVAMALALAALLYAGSAPVLPLFVALLLVRVVNRSTGRPATLVDSVIVTALTGWSTLKLGQPLLGLVGALAFVFDATLREGSARQWAAALACGLASAYVLFEFGIGNAVPSVTPVAAGLAAFTTLAYAAAIPLASPVRSVGDATGVLLDSRRVRAGMLVGLLLVAQSVVSVREAGGPGFDELGLACLLAVGSSALFAAVAGRGQP